MKKIITEDDVISQTIALAVHHWLFGKEDQLKFPGPKYTIGLDRMMDILTVVKESLKEGKEKVEKVKDRLNGNTPSWTARVLLNEGYGKQCIDLEPFEADTKEQAQKISEEKVAELYADQPNTDIIEIKVRRYNNGKA